MRSRTDEESVRVENFVQLVCGLSRSDATAIDLTVVEHLRCVVTCAVVIVTFLLKEERASGAAGAAVAGCSRL